MATKAQRLSLADLQSMKVGVWDLESSSLNGSFGHVLVAGVLPAFTPDLKECKVIRIDKTKGYHTTMWDDTQLIRDTVQELNKYDVLIGFNNLWFDVPLLHTRALSDRLPWLRTDIKHVDIYQFVRKRLRLSSRSLYSLLTQLETKNQKTGLVPKIWRCAVGGHKPSLDKIVEHNIADCASLAEAAARIVKHVDLPFFYVR